MNTRTMTSTGNDTGVATSGCGGRHLMIAGSANVPSSKKKMLIEKIESRTIDIRNMDEEEVKIEFTEYVATTRIKLIAAVFLGFILGGLVASVIWGATISATICHGNDISHCTEKTKN